MATVRADKLFEGMLETQRERTLGLESNQQKKALQPFL
jgi:hypothetical protein